MIDPGPKPHVGGPILPPCAIQVLIGGQPAARVTDKCTCVGPPDVIAKGSLTVKIGGLFAARQFDPTMHGGLIVQGFPTVIIGDVGMGGAGAPSLPTPAPMDKSKFPAERTRLDAISATSFPNLGDNYEVEGPSTPQYNCIAHTLDDHDHWVNPETGDPSSPLSEMDAKYADLGYSRSPSMDASLEPGVEKVAVYATTNPDGSINTVTHGAIQNEDGTWSSKLGRMAQIRHETPDALDGPVYGEPVAIYTRPRS
jgi:uncharacterized Zn-binding protein involved in type VI secretion